MLISSSGQFQDGAFHHTRCVTLDVTAERMAEASRLENERRLNDILQALPAAVYMTDAAGRITFYNDGAITLWGCLPELGSSEFCGSWKLYWPDGTPLPHDECPMALALREKRPNRGMEAVAERPDGTRVPFMPYPSPIFDAAGQLTGAINMLVDITEQKRVQEQRELLLREMNHRIKNLFSLASSMVSLSRRGHGSADDLAGVLRGRLEALAHAHQLTLPVQSEWGGKADQATTLQTLLHVIAAPYLDPDGSNLRITGTGPEVPIRGRGPHTWP